MPLEPLFVLLAVPTLVGHLAVWISLFNRLHAINLPCRLINVLEKVVMLIAIVIPIAYGWSVYGQPTETAFSSGPTWAYALACWLMLIYVAGDWLLRRKVRRPAVLLQNHTTTLATPAARSDLIGGGWMPWIARLPGNQILDVQVQEKTLQVPGLPLEFDGLTIAHVSDLHFTGKLSRRFFEHVIDRCNQWQADLVAVTGDIVDKTRYIDWIPETLGRLEAREGCYFVLGNHDKRVRDVGVLRQALVRSGLQDLGSRWMQTRIRGRSLLLAGNERPWFGELPDMSDAPPTSLEGGPPRILLSHSPDQYPWALQNGFDLVLAGHTHGGQIRFPLIGPIVSPSRFGVRYASGTFHDDRTVMHVTRGLSGLHALRWGCPPELALLRLVSPPSESQRQSPAWDYQLARRVG